MPKNDWNHLKIGNKVELIYINNLKFLGKNLQNLPIYGPKSVILGEKRGYFIINRKITLAIYNLGSRAL